MTVKDLTEATAWLVIAALIVLVAAVAATAWVAPARAGWPDDEFRAQHRKNIVRRYEYRESHRHRRRETRKVIVIRPQAPRENLDGCKPMEHGTGTETRVADPVKRAEQAWSAAVAYKWGEVFADLRNARNASVRCSDPRPDTVVDRAASSVGVDTSRRICRIEAVPCMAPALKWRAKAQ